MDYSIIQQRVEMISSAIQHIGGEVQEIILEEPATAAEIEAVEKTLGLTLPASFKNVLCQFSKHFSMRWFMPDEFMQNTDFSGIFCGTPNWDLHELVRIEEERKGWIETVFPNPEDPYDAVWHHKLAFYSVGNGDYWAFDLRDETIVYLSHDDGQGHGYKIANNFEEMLETWSRVAFVGGEDWQWLYFTPSKTSGIGADGEAANAFRKILELNL